MESHPAPLDCIKEEGLNARKSLVTDLPDSVTECMFAELWGLNLEEVMNSQRPHVRRRTPEPLLKD